MPPSLAKFQPGARSSTIGCSSSVPSSDHVPLLRKAKRPSAGTAATAEAVSWPTAATGIAAQPISPATSGRSTCRRCRSHDRRQERARQSQALEQCPIPVAICDAQELGRRGDGRLGRRLPSQEEAKEIWDQQQRRRALEHLGPRLAQGVELVERVDRQELAAGAGEDLGAGTIWSTSSMAPRASSSR